MDEPTPKGLYCPTCRGVRLTVTHSQRPAPGVRIRYRRCTACGSRVKTRETIVLVTSAPLKLTS